MLQHKRIIRHAISLGLVFGSVAAHATGPASLAEMYASISFADVLATIFSVGVLVIAVDLAQIGYMRARHMIKGAR
jgi:hypothetical protein